MIVDGVSDRFLIGNERVWSNDLSGGSVVVAACLRAGTVVLVGKTSFVAFARAWRTFTGLRQQLHRS